MSEIRDSNAFLWGTLRIIITDSHWAKEDYISILSQLYVIDTAAHARQELSTYMFLSQRDDFATHDIF